MLIVNQGASGEFHIFRGGPAQQFIAQLIIVAHWPVTFKVFAHDVEKAKLFETSGGTFFLALNNESIPNHVGRRLFKHAVKAAAQPKGRANEHA